MATGTSSRMPGTLPPPTSGLVGREAELARARELLGRSRLVTITGPGGVGKSRLAVRAAAEAADRFRDGAHVVELSAVHDPALLAHTLAARLAIPGLSSAESGQGAQQDRLLGFIRERQLLLVLDTCEHLVDACAALADTVLREAPGVTVLATSRQPLDAAGEAVLQLAPLPVPEPGAATAGKADAVELFAQRAAAAVPGFTVTPENLADVITVCRRLDGIPLAIELATVRLRALSLHQMAERIDDRLRLLTGGRRSATPRHQTLRAAIEWSYSLCTPAEQLLWARLSVFAGGFDLAAAEAVCAGGGLGGDEVVLQLPPLPVPEPGAPLAGKADAVELFAQRAAAAVPGFTVTPDNLADVITVCRRLDGIPLAIELATVRLRALSPHQMAERIDDRLRLLTGGRRSGTRRHQTLRAAIEWSYSLCTPAEQLLWARLSVFAGGFDLAAAEAVCAGGDLGGDAVVPTLISLVDKNVLTSESAPSQDPQDRGQPDEPRFRMLDTIREFGAERLHLAGTREIARRRGGLGKRARWPVRADEPGAGIGQAEAAVHRRFIAHYLTLTERFEREPTTDQLGQ